MLCVNRMLSYYHGALPIRVETFETLPSTNTYAMRQGGQGKEEGLLIIADGQTAGRGRYGREFFSPSSSGLYMSVLLRPKSSPESSLKITTAMAVAACEAIEEVVGETPGIKWVNDLYLYGKKVAGILTEGALEPDGNALAFAVVGIGINLTPPTKGFPPALTDLAGAITAYDCEDLREKLAAEILSRFFSYYPSLSDEPLYSRYRERLFVLGKQVTVIRNGQRERATVLDLGRDFRLLLGFSDRETAWLGSEEIRLLPDTESE